MSQVQNFFDIREIVSDTILSLEGPAVPAFQVGMVEIAFGALYAAGIASPKFRFFEEPASFLPTFLDYFKQLAPTLFQQRIAGLKLRLSEWLEQENGSALPAGTLEALIDAFEPELLGQGFLIPSVDRRSDGDEAYFRRWHHFFEAAASVGQPTRPHIAPITATIN